MKYVLGLSFEYKYYENPANIKIFSNNQLIDEIDLTEDIKIKNMTPATLCKNIPAYNDWYYPWWNEWTAPSTSQNWYKTTPEKIFVYTLDETVVQNSIKIEITNNNSNYTNGFMTKWSTITFRHIFLIPAYYLNLKNYASFSDNAKWRINEVKVRELRSGMSKAQGEQKFVANSLKWPDEYRIVKNGQLGDAYQSSSLPFGYNGHWKDHVIGGSFSIKLPIIEYIHEKGLKMLGPLNYEQLEEKEKRRLYQSDVCPLYFNHFNLINTQNETA